VVPPGLNHFLSENGTLAVSGLSGLLLFFVGWAYRFTVRAFRAGVAFGMAVVTMLTMLLLGSASSLKKNKLSTDFHEVALNLVKWVSIY
jgi:hypothetical protein